MTKPYFLPIIFSLFCLITACANKARVPPIGQINPKIIVGYVPGFRGVLEIDAIDPSKLTHINYAFVDVKDSMAWLTNLATDSINFRLLNGLKSQNPDLKILISIGGWSWSENFSDAVLTESSRKKFAESSVEIVRRYHLDGVDIDWEYPGQKGEDNVFRDEDKKNYTFMFEALRAELDGLGQKTGQKYLLSSAVAGAQSFLDHTEMGPAAKPQDFINIMSYDYYTGGPIAGHHSNLFSPDTYEETQSAQRDIDNFVKAGVPIEKIVLGVPFYGRSWIMKTDENHGINMPRDSVVRGGGFSFIRDTMLTNPAFVRYWDEKAKSPYLFNHSNNQLVVYDDEESIKIKCDYVLEHNLAGIMFWQYMSDPKEYLLDVINQKFDNP
jgi:chitinase